MYDIARRLLSWLFALPGVVRKNKDGGREVFRTSDIWLATYLIVEGGAYLGIDGSDPRRCLFQFRNWDGLEDLVAGFWDGSARVAPAEFGRAMRGLKDELFALKRRARMEEIGGEAR